MGCGFRRGGWLKRGDEAVSFTANCFDVARSVGGVSQDLSEAGDRDVEATFVFDEGSFGPDASDQILAGPDFAGSFQEAEVA